MLPAISMSGSILPCRLGFAFFIKQRSADEGGPMNPSAEEAADEGWWMAADDIKVVCFSKKGLSERWGRGRRISLLSAQWLSGPLRTYQCPLIAVKPPVSHMSNTAAIKPPWRASSIKKATQGGRRRSEGQFAIEHLSSIFHAFIRLFVCSLSYLTHSCAHTQ